ncbi:MAG: chemotaxis protein CheB, partial [Bacteroidota bacterium]
MKVVGIGASAGGIEALSSFLQHLPPDTGAAFVIVQHLSPDFKSVMDDLLKRHTSMPLQIIHENTFIKPNHVYLMPGDKTITFEHGMLLLHQRVAKTTLNLPIDAFFHSLGKSLEKDAIGIILSGSGTDGSRGVRTIKERGGLVLVQSPRSAKFDGMPNAAIRLDLADDVLPPQELAQKIGLILKTPPENILADVKNKEQEQKFFTQILAYVKEASQFDFSGYKLATLARRLEKRMLLKECEDLKAYYGFLTDNPAEIDILARSFLIGVTRFFRDRDSFRELETVTIPAIFASLPPNELARIWVPACSTGEEAYTIAILVDQYLRKNNLAHDFKIFASDVNKNAILFASKGVYDVSIAADVPKKSLLHYFQQMGGGYKVKKELKEKIIFAVQDVIKDPPFIRMHLISCRNMLIYLNTDTQNRVLRTFYFALHPAYYMFLGPSENIGDLTSVFDRRLKSINIYTKKEVALPRVLPAYPASNDRWRNKTNVRLKIPPLAKSTSPVLPAVEQPALFANYLLDKHSPTTLFIDEELTILYIQGNVDNLLNLPRALSRLNLKKMVSVDLVNIFADGVLQAINSQELCQYQEVIFKKKEKAISTHLIFQQVDLIEFKHPIVAVEIYVNPTEKSSTSVIAPALSNKNLSDERIMQLRNELHQKNKNIRQLTKKLEVAEKQKENSHRELITTNEELQSTNEELQSVNEELYTVNGELQQKNKETNATYNDLDNLLRSTNIGTIFLDNDLRIRKFTPAIRKHFDLVDKDINRLITSFSHNLKDVDLKAVCEEVLDTLEVYEKQVKAKNQQNFLLRILPYRTNRDEIKGLVITFIDVEDLCSTQSALETLADRLDSIFRNTRATLLFVSPSGEVLFINRSLGDYPKAELAEKNLLEVFPESIATALKEKINQVVQTKKSADLKVQLPASSGTYHYQLSLVPINKEGQAVKSICLTFVEVTKAVKQYQQLESKVAHYKQVIQNASQRMMLLDKKGIIQEINTTNYTKDNREAFIGSYIYDRLLPSVVPNFKKQLEAIFAG